MYDYMHIPTEVRELIYTSDKIRQGLWGFERKVKWYLKGDVVEDDHIKSSSSRTSS